ncbi:hypothetical protein [Pseudomonas vancouverensis]|uniref:Flagellar biosynthesis sigma factor n=1 Tax=Pseudomonas vancouverensis TaxID=95300 RepID=A0A1H2MSU9_PSEVA|nr:hypothetical protein [Pseudomonas vancouverensis]KAB0494488.1 hypothetical protein F7R09_17665 [Pseudomonas vancouverensis]TDB59154.1 hypothetical protein EIY72_19070 [Pseudomonas vancouverensis]SDU96028.1 hypothetical protein SAMN05216558_1187 [Pseudomonas vancouverensis]
MNLKRLVSWRRSALALAAAALITLAAIKELSDEPEISLVIGERYEDMRQRSSASIAPAIPGRAWFSVPKSDARLRFNDNKYGFVTPLARFFTVMFEDERIDGVRMSPQIEPLLLDDTLKVVLDLQDQWRRAGWVPIRTKEFPSFADTPQWRDRLRETKNVEKAYWRAGDKYQLMLVVSRFRDSKRPTEERYLITLGLHKARGVQ